MRVEPDGVTWEYDEGVCKVDFTDSPKSVCEAFHYDPAKAAAYHGAQIKARQEAAAQAQQVLKEDDARRLTRMQSASAGLAMRASPGADVIFRRSQSPAASEATRALGAQMEAAAAKKAVEPTGVWGALANSMTGKILSVLGVDFRRPVVMGDEAAVAVANRGENKGNVHHVPGGFAPDAAHDQFYTPNYSTRSYYEDVDRAEAFARGVPLKP